MTNEEEKFCHGCCGHGHGHGDKKSSRKNGRRNSDGYRFVAIKGLTVYNPAKRDVSCRICKALEARGDTNLLYDGHVSNFPTGCPRYMAFSTDERRKIASCQLVLNM